MEKTNEKPFLAKYTPLFVILAVSFLAGLASGHGMTGFMGFFLLFLSALKLFDIKGFAAEFAKYDFTTKYFPPYAYAYPFIELGLGIGFISNFAPSLILILTILVSALGALGVVKTLMKGEKYSCACMGSSIKLPLSVVSAVEYLMLGLMSIFMLI